MKMNSASFVVSFVVTLLIYSAIAVPTNDPTNLKLSEHPNEHGSQQLYVFGGRNENELGWYSHLSSASHFNSSTGEWGRTTEMSMARQRFCGAVIGTKIHLIGGMDGHETTKTAVVYDCETGAYTPFQSLPSPLYGCGAAVLNGSIYVAGGDNPQSASVIRYNTQTTSWENVSSMNRRRDNFQLVEFKSRLYAIGGWRTQSVEWYNATTDRWTFVASTHYEHTYFGAAVHEGKIYVLSENGFEVFSPEADKWETLTLPNKYFGTELVSMNGKLWSLGGGYSSLQATKEVWTYDTSTKKWTKQADMDIARRFFTAFVINH